MAICPLNVPVVFRILEINFLTWVQVSSDSGSHVNIEVIF